MINASIALPAPYNEPVLTYTPGSAERNALRGQLTELSQNVRELPVVIDGKEIRAQENTKVRRPHKHAHTLGNLQHRHGPCVST